MNTTVAATTVPHPSLTDTACLLVGVVAEGGRFGQLMGPRDSLPWVLDQLLAVMGWESTRPWLCADGDFTTVGLRLVEPLKAEHYAREANGGEIPPLFLEFLTGCGEVDRS